MENISYLMYNNRRKRKYNYKYLYKRGFLHEKDNVYFFR